MGDYDQAGGRRRVGDFTPPTRTDGEPIPIRKVTGVHMDAMGKSLKVSLLDTRSWTMARSRSEKLTLLERARWDDLVVAWAGDRWTDFFEFPDIETYQKFKDSLVPREAVMLTDAEIGAVEAFRRGALPVKPVPRRRKI